MNFNKSYRTHGTVDNKIESFSSRLSIFYDSMSSDCDLYHAPFFKKLKAEPFISVSLLYFCLRLARDIRMHMSYPSLFDKHIGVQYVDTNGQHEIYWSVDDTLLLFIGHSFE